MRNQIASAIPDRSRKIIVSMLNVAMGVIGITAIASVIAVLGFYLSPRVERVVEITANVLLVIFIAQEIFRWVLAYDPMAYIRSRALETTIVALAILELAFGGAATSALQKAFPDVPTGQMTIVYIAITQGTLFLFLLIKGVRYNHVIARLRFSPGAIFILTFGVVILLGSGLLMMPRATVQPISYIDALFTSTSAVCVTGLIVVDTAKEFTTTGQFIIMGLIQIGGLGVMTLTTFFALFLSGGVSLREQILLQDLLSEENIGQVTGLLKRITIFTVLIEAIGAVWFYSSLSGSTTPMTEAETSGILFSSIFHSISAFCNAGFSMYTDGLYEAFIRTNVSLQSCIMVLIVLGGLGFGVLSNLLHYIKFKIQRCTGRPVRSVRLTTNSKLVLLTTVLLLVVGSALVYILEYAPLDNPPPAGEFITSIFISVTARTAGFNTIPMGELLPATVVVVIFLMWIGASPGSTGGGIKTTTIAVAVLNIIRVVTGKERVEIFRRQISRASTARAFSTILLSVIVLMLATTILLANQPGLNPLDTFFEVVSALGTVGLSRGITSLLSDGNKVVIIATMFVGRIGLLTFLVAFTRRTIHPRYTLPEDTITIG